MRPVCLATSEYVDYTEADRALVTGWGANKIKYEHKRFYYKGVDVDESLSDRLRKLEDLR